jgi:hypothetical protein
MINTTEKIFIGIDKEVIELKGEAKAAFILDRQNEATILESRKAEAEAKATQKAALLERLGITEAEARLLLG